MNRRKIFSIVMLLTLFFNLLPLFSPSVSALVVNPGTYFVVGNENYTVSHSMNFSSVSFGASWIRFNNTDFNVTSANDIWFELDYLASNPLIVPNGSTVLQFNATTSAGNVFFNLSGFNSGYYYSILLNGSEVDTVHANASGNIIFHNSVWSKKNITIVGTVGIPVVNTSAASNVEETTVTLNGNQTGATISTGFEYGLTSGYGSLVGFSSTSQWTSNATIINGLTDVGSTSAPSVFNMSGTWYLISGEYEGTWTGWHWNGTAWVSDAGITAGLSDVGTYSTLSVFNMSGTWYLIGGEYDGVWNGWHWNGAAWVSDAGIKVGLTDVGSNSAPSVFNMSGTWYLISGDSGGNWEGWHWNGAAWVSDANIVLGLSKITNYAAPCVFYANNTWYLISGRGSGTFSAWRWTGAAWSGFDSIRYGLTDVGDRSALSAFNINGTWYVISGEYDGVWNGWHHTFLSTDFSYNLIGLSPGTLYHYRAYANNSAGTGYGSDVTFVTKPNAPTTLTTTPATTSIALSWVKGTGANRTVIVMKQTGYPSSRTDGAIVYNNTGTSYNHAGLNPGEGYFYRAWSYSKWNTLCRWSDGYTSDSDITRPEAPTGPNITFVDATHIKLNWTKGTGANNTVVLRKQTGYPTSVTDGTIIYNGTGLDVNTAFSFAITYYYRAWSYSEWHNLNCYSTNYTNITYPPGSNGTLFINCYDESTGTNLTFNILITNKEGTDTYYDTNCVNTLMINASLCPQGLVTLVINSTGHRSRIYTFTIMSGIFYQVDAYLPLSTSGGDESQDCDLISFTNSIAISDPDVDATITLTHDLESIISVEIYNSTLYGTYGGWMLIPESNYTTSSTQVTINESVLDDNTTMARVTYYYMYCPDQVIATPLYYIRVVETISTDYIETDKGVEDAYVTISRYINSTSSFKAVSSLYTDANGYINLYMLPNVLYKFTITKTGYDTKISDYIPTPANEWGQTTEKVFRITRNTTVTPNEDLITFWDIITFNATMYSNNTIKVTYIDSYANTTNAQFYTYDLYNFTATLISTNTTVNDTFIFWVMGINTSHMHRIILHVNQTNLGYVTKSYTVSPLYNGNLSAKIEGNLSSIFGVFDLGYVKFFFVFLPFIGLVCLGGTSHTGLGVIGGGLWFGFSSVYFSLPTTIVVIAPFIVALGFVLFIVRGGEHKL